MIIENDDFVHCKSFVRYWRAPIYIDLHWALASILGSLRHLWIEPISNHILCRAGQIVSCSPTQNSQPTRTCQPVPADDDPHVSFELPGKQATFQCLSETPFYTMILILTW